MQRTLSQPPVVSPWTRIPSLDGLRGIAVLLVVSIHYSNGLSRHGETGRLIETYAGFGATGVDLFFVLSGFLITSILLRERNASDYYSQFYRRRICRIVPLYLLLLLVIVFLMPHIPILALDENLAWDGAQPWWFFLFVQNYGMGVIGDYRPRIFAPAWSLAVEEHFYAVLPVTIRALSIGTLSFWIMTAWGLSIITRLAIINTGIVPVLATETWSVCRVDAIAAGVLAALFISRKGRVGRLVLIFSLLILTLCFALPQFGTTATYGLRATVLALGYAGILLYCVSYPSAMIPVFIASDIFRWLGKISYGVYLLHAPIRCVLLAAARELRADGSDVPGFVVTPAALLLTLWVAHISWNYFERPIVNWSHHTFKHAL